MDDMKIVWGDIEATGLHPSTDVILEVGLRVTDWWGSEIQRITLPVWNNDWKDLLNRGTKEAVHVKEMHINSGLVDTLVAIDMQSERRYLCRPGEQERRLIEWLERYAGTGTGPIDGKYAFAGNSVGYDRKFLAWHMPSLDEWFHYRVIDVSSLAEVCRVVNPVLHSKAPQPHRAHRPQEDIDNSILYWRYYIENFLHEGED